jgi:hypothetical protein
MKPVVALSLMLLALAGCANRPSSIHASFVSHERFVGLNCYALAQRMDTSETNLAELAAKQDAKADGDALGVFLVGVPVSKLTGDYEAEIARTKGEIEAIETAQVKNSCPVKARAPLPPAKTGCAAAANPSRCEDRK